MEVSGVCVFAWQVGLLYQQRAPPFVRPTSRGILRCLARWYYSISIKSHILLRCKLPYMRRNQIF